TELDYIKARISCMFDTAHNTFWPHRQITNRCADRLFAIDLLHDPGNHIGWQCAKRALVRILEVDDVGAGVKGKQCLVHIPDTGEKPGHARLLPEAAAL